VELMMNKEQFQQLKEDDLVNEVLIPLFRRMEYKEVFKHHGGSGEKGKDVVFWKPHLLGGRKNYAVVAKAVKLSAKANVASGTAAEIVMQVRQCFGNDYLDSITAEPQKVHECWVVSNKAIPKEAIEL